MTNPALASPSPEGLDLTAPPPYAEAVSRLERLMIESPYFRAVEQAAEESSYLRRVQRLCDVFRDLEPEDGARFLMAATKLALKRNPAGLRVLFSFLNVKAPGVEVLRRLQSLTGMERVALRLVSGTWREPEETGDSNPAYAILEVLDEATRLGVLDLGLERLPRDSRALRATFDHLRRWYAAMTVRLASRETLPEDHINFLVQICMLEIHLTERRISRLAESIDPYDMRGMARLMPVLSRYDQDIEHMKTVISRLTTYMPFYERMLTVENAITDREMDKVQRELQRHPVGFVLAELIDRVRSNPILDREYFYLVSVVHQVATLRALALDLPRLPDLLGTMVQVLDQYVPGLDLPLMLEPEALEEIWPTLETWGVFTLDGTTVRLAFRDDRSLDFIEPDGTPRLPDAPEPREESGLPLNELVRMQMQNDAFLLGVLDNPKAAQSRIVCMIAVGCRSIRVLEKIARTRPLHTGAANKDVPRLLLLNPARLSINTLRRFIHVRFVNRLDLQRMAMPTSDIRPEVRSEIQAYLRTLKS